MTKKQRDLFGNIVSEDIVIYGINAIKSKIDGTSTNHDLIHIRQRVENPFREITEKVRKQFLQYLTVETLKNECRARGIKGYSGKKKSELSNLIFKNLTSKELEDFFFKLSENETRLKEFKINKQKRYRDLANIIARENELLKSDPDNIEAWETKIEALIELEIYEDALLCVDKALESEPYEQYHLLMNKAKIHKELHDEDEELECYTKLINRDHYRYPIAELRKALILMKRREFDEAIILLDGLYICEGYDVLWPKALFHKARIAALQNNKEDMINNLQKSVRFENAFQRFTFSQWEKQKLKEDIKQTPEFAKFWDSEELQSFINYEWELEDKIDIECEYFTPDGLWEDTPYAKLEKALILIKRREFDEAIILLDGLGIVRKVLFHKARIAALQNNKEDIIKNLQKSVRSDLHSRYELIEDIKQAPEFDKYLNSEELQSIINLSFIKNIKWELEYGNLYGKDYFTPDGLWEDTPYAKLEKALLLIKKKEFGEAISLLDGLYECEYWGTLRKALFRIAHSILSENEWYKLHSRLSLHFKYRNP